MAKRLFYFFAALLLEVPLLRAQIDLQRSNSLLYAPLSLYVQGERRIVNALIDTGCSLCMIDSTYAVDSCAWNGVREDSLWVTGAEGDGARLSRIVLDSLSIAGQCYRKVPCVVMNLRERLRHHAPNFLLGADILRRERWQFDLKRYRLKRMVGEPPQAFVSPRLETTCGEGNAMVGHLFQGKTERQEGALLSRYGQPLELDTTQLGSTAFVCRGARVGSSHQEFGDGDERSVQRSAFSAGRADLFSRFFLARWRNRCVECRFPRSACVFLGL